MMLALVRLFLLHDALVDGITVRICEGGQMTSLDEKSSRQRLEREQACFFYGDFLMSIKSVSQKSHLCPSQGHCL